MSVRLVTPIQLLKSELKRNASAATTQLPLAETQVPVQVAELDAFGRESLDRLGGNPQPYRLNAAILNFALRYFQLSRITPKRDANKLHAVFIHYGNAFYDCWLAVSRVELSKPPKPEAGMPPVAEPPRQPTTFDLLSELYKTF